MNFKFGLDEQGTLSEFDHPNAACGQCNNAFLRFGHDPHSMITGFFYLFAGAATFSIGKAYLITKIVLLPGYAIMSIINVLRSILPAKYCENLFCDFNANDSTR